MRIPLGLHTYKSHTCVMYHGMEVVAIIMYYISSKDYAARPLKIIPS